MYDISNKDDDYQKYDTLLGPYKMYDLSNGNYHDRDGNLVWKHVKCMTYQTAL